MICFFLRHEEGSTPRFTDRLVLDRTIRAKLGPGGNKLFSILLPSKKKDLFSGSLNLDEDSKNNLRNYSRKQQAMTDELARNYMYTSTQQAAFDEVQWGKIIYLIHLLFFFQIKNL